VSYKSNNFLLLLFFAWFNIIDQRETYYKMINLSKFKKSIQKHGIQTDFVEADSWISTGIYSLNFCMSGKFNVGIPNRRSVMFWGPSGTGKSYLVSHAALEAQRQGYHVIYIDSETAANKQYMEKIGLELTKEKFTMISVSSLEDGIRTMSNLFKELLPTDKVFIAFDSLSMALSEKEINDFDKGESKGDMGQQAKKLKQFMKNINVKIGKYDMFFVCTGHAYMNQNIQSGDGLWLFSGGKGVEFIPSISILLTKLKLKDTATSDIIGVRVRAEITKSRYTKLGGKVEIEVPYETGFDPLSGLVEMAEKFGLITKSGAWYTWNNGNEDIKFQKKTFGNYYKDIFKLGGENNPTEENTNV
jgi:recombination protein RecA